MNSTTQEEEMDASVFHSPIGRVNKTSRAALKGQRSCVVWLTGISGAGKSTIANLVEERLHDMGRHTYVLDGDSIRSGLNRDLGYEDADRIANIRRTAEVAKLMADAGLIVVVALISPFRAERSLARALLSDGEFLEVFVDTPVHVAEQRDVKGLYKKARSGELRNFTGIDSIYQSPESPELRLETVGISPEEAADRVVDLLRKRRFVLF
jgi:bifunctional enzyme CysN/CysC